MKDINIGTANNHILNLIRDSMATKNVSSINNSKKITSEYVNLINSSPILLLEFKIFDNITKKHISDDFTIGRYIDDNIKLFESFTIQEYNDAHNQLGSILNEGVSTIGTNDILFTAVSNLITESLKRSIDVDVDVIHESFAIVSSYIKNNKPKAINKPEIISEEVLEIAFNKFNERYNTLDENDMTLLSKLNKLSTPDKFLLFEEYKTETINRLNKLDNSDLTDKIEKMKIKINEMVVNDTTINDTIINLHELKKAIL